MDEGRNMILLFPSLIKFKSAEEKEQEGGGGSKRNERRENVIFLNGDIW